MLGAALQARWYADAPAPLLLRPLAALYALIATRRRARLQQAAVHVELPVIVVGNIAVGGTGKTPVTIWLIERLRAWGWRPGVVGRGYGGRAPRYPYAVTTESDPAHCGDEPLLIARRSGCPVVVDPDRVAAARALTARGDVDIIVADDGLQHYRLARDLEIGVVDGVRGLGNRALLPAGPLREPATRLQELDLVVVNGAGWNEPLLRPLHMELQATRSLSMAGDATRPLQDFRAQSVHAVAGIGHPPRFFATLRAAGIDVREHPFADHHRFTAADLDFGDALPVLMTEKDAVKCARFAQPHWWAVPVDAVLSAADTLRVQESVARLRKER
jgi:tetraacyldisaccharide 4'-kinase